MYKIEFHKKFIEKLGLKENKEIKRRRFDTYFSYITYKTTLAKVTKQSVIDVCNCRLQDMETSTDFDGEFVQYLNTKKLEELQYK